MTLAIFGEISSLRNGANCKMFEAQVFPVKLVVVHIWLAARIPRHRWSPIIEAKTQTKQICLLQLLCRGSYFLSMRSRSENAV